ncbi:MAG TPA: phosphatase PAP2 family protein [Mycobacteriales bacterium]|nr:phosphatase PAP2 family protein [Mycobacteriales bacterium]
MSRQLVVELVVLGSLFLLYRFGRTLSGDHVEAALRNADQVWLFERSWNLVSELHLQRFVLGSPDLVVWLNRYYIGMHFPTTILFLVWTYVFHPQSYPRTRWRFVIPTFLALVVHTVYPLAPPRMLDSLGFVDTMAVYGPSAYGPPDPGAVANQFAAMPSLHFGWAVLVAFGVVTLGTSHWRWIVLLHPVITLAVIVLTANHYWVDAIAVIVLIGAAFAVERMVLVTKPRLRGVRRHGDAQHA